MLFLKVLQIKNIKLLISLVLINIFSLLSRILNSSLGCAEKNEKRENYFLNREKF